MTTEATARGRTSRAGWIAAAVLLVIAAGAGVYAANLRNQLEDVQLRLVDAVLKLQLSEERVTNMKAASDAMQQNLAIIAAADTVEMVLKGAGAAPNANGRVFTSQTHGLLFSATGLPLLQDEQSYQLWFLTRGAPVSAGLVRPDQQGNVTAAFDPVKDAPTATGFSVSLEGRDGADKPTGPIVLSAEQKR